MDLHGIDLNLLVAFDALMAERSVTRAGVRIGRTQPAMSAALSRLRALLHDDLFIRGPDGLQPTPRAVDLAEPLGHALAEIQRTLDFTQVFDPSTSSITFSMGLSDHAAFVVLPKLLSILRKQAPGVVLRIRNFDHRNDVISLLDSGEADLTVGVPHTSTGRIVSERLFEENFVCILRRDHPEADAELTLQSFLQMSHLLVSPENERFGVVDAALAKLGLRRRLALTLPQMYAAPPLIASSDLIATLMKGVVDASGYREQLCVLNPPLELESAKFDLSWHRRNEVHPAQRWLRGVIGSIFKISET
jgi:DNA-binding transcriptional LysR family regulator